MMEMCEEMGGFMLPEEFIGSYKDWIVKLLTAPSDMEAIRIAQEKKGAPPTFKEVMDVFREHFGYAVERRAPLEIPKLRKAKE